MEDIQFKRLEKIENIDISIAECEIKDFTKFIENKNNYSFVGIKDNKVIAFLYGYGMLRPDCKNMFYIHSVDVHSEYQTKEIGTTMEQVNDSDRVDKNEDTKDSVQLSQQDIELLEKM